MNAWSGRLLVVVALGLSVLAGWRLWGSVQAEGLATSNPAAALAWRPNDPHALQAQADALLKSGNGTAAEIRARTLLAHAPLQGTAFRSLAEVAQQRRDVTRALALYQIAARRAPRDLATHSWLAQHALGQGQASVALDQIDQILRIAPRSASTLYPVLVDLASDPEFSAALGTALAARPPWRNGLLAALGAAARKGNADPEKQVMTRLHAQGGLSREETRRWIDSLMAQGRWGEALARWAGEVVRPGGRLPLLYNGDFATDPDDFGFDWRLRRVPGVLIEFVPAPDGKGRVAHLQFLDRRVPDAGLEHPLALFPGSYRLTLSMRARSLRGALGLEWQMICAGSAGIIGRQGPIDGSFDWQPATLEFTVPEQGCPGQRLRLANMVTSGAAQTLGGDLWVRSVDLRHLGPRPPWQ
ncbi:MAG: hypothetical protein H3C34_03680 [Caldilineaceae bacterium]|nr:hypothetical protein [Caldilineaceae bacterium]